MKTLDENNKYKYVNAYPRGKYLTVFHSVVNILYLISATLVLLIWWKISIFIDSLLLVIIVSLYISLQHQRFLSEWLHEASHFNLTKNKYINDLLANLLIGTFFGITVKNNRNNHYKHHQVAVYFSDDDPDTYHVLVLTRKELWRHILKDMLCINAFSLFFAATSTNTRDKKRNYWFLYLAIIHLLLIYGLYSSGYIYMYVLYYSTLLCLYPLINRIRLYSQHALVIGDGNSKLCGSRVDRTIRYTLFDRLFFVSNLMLYHYEHHYLPGLPYRALKAMHNDLALEKSNLSSMQIFFILLKDLK